jgi:ammonium transporter, Amt family
MTFKRPTLAGWAVLTIAALCTIGFVDAAFAQSATSASAAAAAAPVPNKGDTAWMLIASALVLMMSIPGLALFYGGLVRTKNMASVLTQVFAIVSLVGVVWTLYGYSLAFGDGGSMTHYIGGFAKAFMHGVDANSTVATFSNGVVIPEYAYFVFQMTFAMITPALIVGAFAERIKFSAVMLFILLWVTFIYFPIAHWVWYVPAPDDVAAAAKALAAATTGAAKAAAQARLDAVTGNTGWLAGAGALDFAGGTVVHINAGIAGLVGALVLGKRKGYPTTAMPPHNLAYTVTGASLLWVGWFGFNAGSAVAANGIAGMAMTVTQVATATAALAWMFVEWFMSGKPTTLGIASGAVAGLVAITPASGYVGPIGALGIGVAAGVIPYLAATKLKHALGYDDSLDAFGVHCVGGIVGALLTGVFCAPVFGGHGFSPNATTIGHQVWIQCGGVVITLVVSGVASFIAMKVAGLLTGGARVTEDQETEGLDLVLHNEKGLNI